LDAAAAQEGRHRIHAYAQDKRCYIFKSPTGLALKMNSWQVSWQVFCATMLSNEFLG